MSDWGHQVTAANGLKQEAKMFNLLMNNKAVHSVSVENKAKLLPLLGGYASKHPVAFLVSWHSTLVYISDMMNQPTIGSLMTGQSGEKKISFTNAEKEFLVEEFKRVHNKNG